MKKIVVIILVLFSVVCAFGLKVILNNGNTIEGELRGKSRDKIYVYVEEQDYIVGINLHYVATIIDQENNIISQEVMLKKDFSDKINFNNYFELTDTDLHYGTPLYATKLEMGSTRRKVRYEMLAATAVFAYLSLDNIIYVGSKNDSENSWKTIDKGHKVIGAIVCGVAAVFTLANSVERVEVQASPTSLSLSYKF